MRDATLSFQRRLRLAQVSALCIRRGADGGEELVAVGDEDFVVVTAPLRAGSVGDDELHAVGDILDDELRDASPKSEWEAVASDGTGRVFAIAEDSATKFGPRDDAPLGFGVNGQLGRDDEFTLSQGDKTKLYPLRSWELPDDDEDEVESANDLALDGEGRLHAISSRSRCVYELTHDGAIAALDARDSSDNVYVLAR